MTHEKSQPQHTLPNRGISPVKRLSRTSRGLLKKKKSLPLVFNKTFFQLLTSHASVLLSTLAQFYILKKPHWTKKDEVK